jgi:hypothetical protein
VVNNVEGLSQVWEHGNSVFFLIDCQLPRIGNSNQCNCSAIYTGGLYTGGLYSAGSLHSEVYGFLKFFTNLVINDRLTLQSLWLHLQGP